MIIRRIWTCCLFALFSLNFIKSQETDPTTTNPNKLPDLKCDPEMFSCIKDASCIPMDWVGDNELDCSDGSDEHNTQGVSPNPAKANKAKLKVW